MFELDDLDPIWKALADPTRRHILDLLQDEPKTTGALCAAFEDSLSRFAVIKHVAVLHATGLVVARRDGRQVWHYLNAIPIRRIYERWVRPYESHWATSLLRLRDDIEGNPIAERKSRTMHEFRIEQEVTIRAPPDRVFSALTTEIDRWWHLRLAPSGSTLHLESHPGGRFWEEVTDPRESVLWATVTRVAPGRRLELTGPMSMTGPVLGNIIYLLEPRDRGTLLKMCHLVFGEVPDRIREDYAAGWKELLENRLPAHVEQRGGHLSEVPPA